MDLQVILASTVIATLINTIANMYNSKRTGNLKYITEERQKWREEIRKIAEDIMTCPRKQIKKHLTRLKVRINANGKIALLNNDVSFFEDSHIWQLIDKLENSNLSNSNYKKEINNLVNALSLLLKFDWERQKEEVRGSDMKRLHMIFCVCALSITIYTIGIPTKLSIEGIEPSYVIILFCVLIPSFIQLFEHVIIKAIRGKRRILLTILSSALYLLGIIAIIYIAGNIIGILMAESSNDVTKALVIIMIVFYSLDLVTCTVNISIPIYKMRRYERDAEIILNL